MLPNVTTAGRIYSTKGRRIFIGARASPPSVLPSLHFLSLCHLGRPLFPAAAGEHGGQIDECQSSAGCSIETTTKNRGSFAKRIPTRGTQLKISSQEGVGRKPVQASNGANCHHDSAYPPARSTTPLTTNPLYVASRRNRSPPPPPPPLQWHCGSPPPLSSRGARHPRLPEPTATPRGRPPSSS